MGRAELHPITKTREQNGWQTEDESDEWILLWGEHFGHMGLSIAFFHKIRYCSPHDLAN